MQYDPALSPICGVTTPRIFTKPLRELTRQTSRGFAAIEFGVRVLGMELIPWQADFLIRALELGLDGKQRFRTVLLLVSRQNGKSAVMKIMALYRLFADPSCELVLGVAHKLAGAKKPWDEARKLVLSIPALKAQTLKPRIANGDLCIPLKNGSAWRAESSEPDATRGWSADLLFFDELRTQETRDAWTAAKATTTARPNGMAVGVSNAGTGKSVVLRELRNDAISKINDPTARVAILEWSAPEGCDLDDRAAWAQANPSLGYTLDIAVLEEAAAAPDPRAFRTEHLCQWVETEVMGPWEPGAWEALTDAYSEIDPASEFTVSVETGFDRAMTYISIAGWRTDGKAHIETIAQRAGSAWVVPALAKQWPEWSQLGASTILIQGSGSNATELIELLEAAHFPVTPVKGTDLGASFGAFYDAVKEGRLHHRGQQLLDLAASAAQTKTLGQIRVFDDKGSPVEVAPLQAASFAYWGLTVADLRRAKKRISAYETETDPDEPESAYTLWG